MTHSENYVRFLETHPPPKKFWPQFWGVSETYFQFSHFPIWDLNFSASDFFQTNQEFLKAWISTFDFYFPSILMKKIEVAVFLIELRKVYYLSSLVKFVHIYSKLKNCKLEVKLVFFWKLLLWYFNFLHHFHLTSLPQSIHIICRSELDHQVDLFCDILDFSNFL